MAANELTITFVEIQKTVAREIGWNRDPDQWSTDQDNDFLLICDKGMRQFYRPPPLPGENKVHNWSFLYPKGELQLSTSYSTGTVEVVSGVCTFTGSTMPSWAAQGDIWLDDNNDVHQQYTINTRDSDSQVTLDDTTVDIDAATTFEIIRRYYDLPDDFGGMYSTEFTYRRDAQWTSGGIQIVSERMIRDRDRSYTTDQYPSLAALIPVPATTTESSRTRVTFWPLSSSTEFVEFRYVSIPPALTEGGTLHYGGADHSETVVASIVDQAIQMIHHSTEKHQQFMERLQQSVLYDRRNHFPDYIGKASKSYGGDGGLWRDNLRQMREDTSPDNMTFNFG